MKRVLKVFGIVMLVLLVITAAFVGRAYYKIKNFKDTHDLQAQIADKCGKYLDQKKAVGLAVGVVQGDKVYITCFGLKDKDSQAPVDTNTVFEIGSITKVFTTELTQVLADKGVLNWNETIYDDLAPELKPKTNDSTTLLSLATHTSGFPNTPQLLKDKAHNSCDPYRDMKLEDYQNCIKNLLGKTAPDITQSNYSNMGMSVLANCAANKAGTTYDSLLAKEILSVLDMTHTTVQNPADSLIFATGYDKDGNKACHWNLPLFYTGCGGLRSNITDMVKFLKANLSGSTLSNSFLTTQQEIYKNVTGGIGKGWQIDKVTPKVFGVKGKAVWHNGGTGGFKSYIGMVPETKTGIVILSNQYRTELDALGIELLMLSARVSLKE